MKTKFLLTYYVNINFRRIKNLTINNETIYNRRKYEQIFLKSWNGEHLTKQDTKSRKHKRR